MARDVVTGLGWPQSGRSGPEHPIDVAMRTTFGGAPVPHRPSRWSTGAWRALVLVAAVVVVWSALTVADTPPPGPRGVSAAADVVTLAVLMVWAWWVAGEPVVDPTEARGLRSRLGPENYREVSRALRRGQPVPPEWRTWATAVLHQQQRATLAVSVVTMGAVSTSLRTATGQRDPSTIPPTVAAGLSIGCAVLAAAGIARRWWIHRRATQLGLTGAPSRTARPASGGVDG